jgi:3-oxoacyl-[acyl-carrier-protein] synthase-3
MQGTSVFTFTISDVPRVIRDYFLETNTTVDDYDCFAFHQANHMILKQIAKKIKIPEEKMPISLHRFGNTSGASPFLTLCNTYGLIEDKKLKVLLCAFGVGLSWGTCALHINTSDIFEIIEDDTIFEEGVIKSVNELL